MSRPEILAPAGSMESLVAAVRCGADAVYVGGSKYSARAGAVNFTDEELAKAADYCHLHNVKIYQALNTLFFDGELEQVAAAAKRSAAIGMDAFIVQDMGAARMLREILPDMKLNASTQMTIHTKQGALLAKELGFSRVVVSRELSMEQIREICTADIEVECFVHGALCMSVSGQCYMSAMIGSRSADRGMCAQACRLPFSAIKGQERYDLSLKDMSHAEHITELAQAGVTSLKIEGRMKRAEYVAAAVTACRDAADGRKPDMERLRAVFSRSGFTDGYFTGKLGADMFGTRQKEDVISAEKVFPELRELYRRESKVAAADFRAVIKRDTPAKLTMSCEGISISAEGDVPQEAVNRPTDAAALEKQLSKLGDTVYTLGKISLDTDGGLMLPASQINAMRRDVCESMDKERTERNTPKYKTGETDFNFIKLMNIKHRLLRAEISRIEQLDGITDDIDKVIVPLDLALKYPDRCAGYSERLIIALPRFTVDEGKLIDKIKGIDYCKAYLCTNIAHVKICRDMGLKMHGGFGLNVTNTMSLKALSALGVKDATASFEMKLTQINTMGDYLDYGMIIYGRLPLMLTRNCPVKQAVGGCKNCTGALTDRTGRTFPVRCDGVSCEVLNSELLVMTDRLREINVSFVQLNFYDESPEEVRRVTGCCRRNENPAEKGYTRGLYYRGII